MNYDAVPGVSLKGIFKMLTAVFVRPSSTFRDSTGLNLRPQFRAGLAASVIGIVEVYFACVGQLLKKHESTRAEHRAGVFARRFPKRRTFISEAGQKFARRFSSACSWSSGYICKLENNAERNRCLATNILPDLFHPQVQLTATDGWDPVALPGRCGPSACIRQSRLRGFRPCPCSASTRSIVSSPRQGRSRPSSSSHSDYRRTVCGPRS